MRIVKHHRRTAIAVGAFTTALAMSVTTLVVAATISGTDTIKDRLDDPRFALTATVLPAPQTIDPATLCLAAADPTIATCELWAKEADIDLPGVGPVKVWGYARTADGPPMLPGPTIVATAGDDVTVLVHDVLPSGAGDLGFSARSMSVAERTLIAHGGEASYTFTAASAGTSVYSASADSATGNRQIAMGLAGALVVHPDAASCALGDPAAFMGCAYGDPTVLPPDNAHGDGSVGWDIMTDSYHGEAIVAMNEIDTDLAADPLGFDMTNYRPDAHLVNGRTYPATQVIDGMPGQNVLIRYVNLGLADHSMGLIGAHQRTLGRDGMALPHGSDDVTIPLNVGQTADVMVSIPLNAKAGFRYALADESRQPGTQAADPAMTFLTVWGPESHPGLPVGTVDFVPPALDEPPTDATNGEALAFTYTIPSGATAAQWSIDDPGVGAKPLDMSGDDSIDTTTLSELVNGPHILWVQWSDGTAFGDPSGIAFVIDRAGPVVTPVVDVDPTYSNGTQDITLTATADSTLTGTGEVAAAVFTIDSCPTPDPDTKLIPGGSAMGSNGPAPVVALDGKILAGTFAAEGRYKVNVQAQDNRGTWSNNGQRVGDDPPPAPLCGKGDLVIDTHAPTVSGADVTPNDNDGTMAFPTLDSYLPVVRITATVTDPALGTGLGSGIASVEGFIDDGQPVTLENDTGFLFTPVDGNFDSASEAVYADIPLASVATLKPGEHKIWIHGQDLAGNWGSITVPDPTDTEPSDGIRRIPGPPSTTLTIVNTAPQVTDVYLDSTNGGVNDGKFAVTIAGKANGAQTNIVAYEYTLGASAPALVDLDLVDQSPVLTVTLQGVTLGVEDNIAVRIQDSTGKWSAVQYGRSTVSSLVVNWTNIAHTRWRLQGFAIPAPNSTVDRVGWSADPNTLPTNSTSTSLSGTTINYINPNAFGTPGGQMWVRVRDAGTGQWGPATSVSIPPA